MCWQLVNKHCFDWVSATTPAEIGPPDGIICDCGAYIMRDGKAIRKNVFDDHEGPCVPPNKAAWVRGDN